MSETQRDELAELLEQIEAAPQIAADPRGIIETRAWTREADAILAAGYTKPQDESGDHMTRPEWSEWSNSLAAHMGDRWDDDVAQEAIIDRFMEHYGTLDSLINELAYEGEVDEIVTITHNRETGKFTIVGVGPAGEADK